MQRIESKEPEPKRITIRLTREQHKHCKKYKKRSVSELIRELIDDDIKTQSGERNNDRNR